MAKKATDLPEDPEMRRLALEEREAEVRTRKARADQAEADAHRKKRESGMEEDDPDLAGKLAGGVTRDRYVTIFRKLPGEARWPYWKKHLPLDEIDSIEDFLTAEGDPRYEHKVVVHNDKQKPIKKPIFFPAMEADPALGPSSTELDRKLKESERKLADARKAKALERNERKVRKLLGEDEDDEDGEGGEDDHVFVPHLGGWFPKSHPLAMGGMMPGMMPPWMQQPANPAADMLKMLVPVLVAWIGKPQERNPLDAVLPLLISSANKGQLEPKDMLGMFSPFVAEMSRMSSQSTAALMEGMQKMDDTFRKKMLDLLMSDPSRTPDEIEKWQKWLNFGETALRKGATIVRDAMKEAPGGKITQKIEKRKTAALTGPRKEGEKGPEGGGDKAAGGGGPEAPAPEDPQAAALALKKRRIEAFLLAAEEEMLAESDPGVVAEKVEELYLILPRGLRIKIEEAVADDPPQDEKLLPLFMALKETCPEITERLVKAIMDDTEKQTWIKDFLVECATEPEEEPPAEQEEGAEEEPVDAEES